MKAKEQKKKRYTSHRKWVENNLERYRAYHKKYNALESTKIRRKEIYRKNIEHIKKRDREHYYKTRDRHRELHISKRYGISVERYREMFKVQKSLCAICGESETVKNKVLSVDHNHKTGEVRGLLCGHCNRALGYLREDISLLPKIQKYLEHYAKTT